MGAGRNAHTVCSVLNSGTLDLLEALMLGGHKEHMYKFNVWQFSLGGTILGYGNCGVPVVMQFFKIPVSVSGRALRTLSLCSGNKN